MTQEISALMDGELSKTETERTIKALRDDESLGSAWRGYHLIGDALRAEHYERPGLESRILTRLQQEPTVLAPRRLVPTQILPRIALVAAASIATISVVAWLAFIQEPAKQPQVVQAPTTLALQPASVSHVEPYLYAHKEFSAAPDGLIPAGFGQVREQDPPR
ncbi:MAG: sigma-E factor negative regulatory protein [Burkholderiales bacterium]